MLIIEYIKAFSDNYIWLLKNNVTQTCIAIDPGEAGGVLAWLQVNANFKLEAILITHHHFDHTGGIKDLQKATNAPIYAPQNEPIAADFALKGGENLALKTAQISVIATPGHTKGHLSYLTCDNLFCGDTLFAAGCGRIFEGTHAQMYNSLLCLAKLSPATKIYCAHEYTLSNLKFAQTIEPHNQIISHKLAEVKILQAQNLPSIPTVLADELQINPFLRCDNPSLKQAACLYLKQNLTDELAVFTALRSAKDNF